MSDNADFRTARLQTRHVPYGRTLCVYEPHTPDRVVNVLEDCITMHRYYDRNRRVRLFYGDTESEDFERVHNRKPDPGHTWDDEFMVTGMVGKSTGVKPIPILLANSRSDGGPGILDGCIVRLIVDRMELYRHPNYHNDFDTASVKPSELADQGYTHAVVPSVGQYAGQEVARFRSLKSAQNYLAFMKGERMSK